MSELLDRLVGKVNALEDERDRLRAERDEAREKLASMRNAAITEAGAIERLMEDRVLHVTALRQIVTMTETGIIAKGGHDVYRLAVQALADTDAATRSVNAENTMRETRERAGLGPE